MAERSFKKEVETLRKGKGEVWQGEGILAVTKALLENGVGYVGGYQGSPISHLMDVFADADPLLKELGVYFENSASEAGAAAMLSASMMYPVRGAVTWKSTVGTNVASDALSNLSSSGVLGGALVIVGEDYGEGSSIMQERTHAFAMKSQMWLIDPRPNLESIVKAVSDGFNLSEASNTPVILQLRVRSCHLYGQFIANDNKRPDYSLSEALNNPERDVNRIVLPPASFKQEQEKVKSRMPRALEYIKKHKLNEVFQGEREDIGIIVQGGLYNNLNRALALSDLSDHLGNTKISTYVMNVTYPVVPDEIAEFCKGKTSVLLIEEGQPNYIEQNLSLILNQKGIDTKIYGKELLPEAGDYTIGVIQKALPKFLDLAEAENVRAAREKQWVSLLNPEDKELLETEVPVRPAGFCTGCPERPIFAALKLVMENLGDHHISADIGCHLFSILPPFNLGTSTMGYGLGPSSASAFNTINMEVKDQKRVISIMGDGGFWHNGLNSGIGNAVFNNHDGVIIIVDNNYAAATGGQDVPSSKNENPIRSTKNSIENAVRGVGVKWVELIDHTYDVQKMVKIMTKALTTTEGGPKVIIAQSECSLNKQRREKKIFRQKMKEEKRVVKERFGVDSKVCSGDHECMRLSGCPSLTLDYSENPLKDDPVAKIDNSCVACGNCGEVAEAAVLCPSFYKAQIVNHPGAGERMAHNFKKKIINYLQKRRDRKRIRA
ncbi:indolepyruvate ferredoxin oxidoreductase subunit alpha [Sediminicola luteus]|uniref:Indolepyruvate ferredoxin oxidoreductase n=1 Tax=Sediminicola luteus TaxID=319238 RepID=A0A2A4GBS6_9FLAO|nr:indolepyruvate ferredoxin oxidoreductase subunit alpha [Sediminicola luteus]PCE65903.1 indolepyruvate ferredoxin oxidoreductase [Sediminicola luteus]